VKLQIEVDVAEESVDKAHFEEYLRREAILELFAERRMPAGKAAPIEEAGESEYEELGPGIPEPPQAKVPAGPNRHKIADGYHVLSKPVLGGLHHEYRLEKEAA